MTKTCIIGIGNTLRGDDGIGVRVAEELSSVDLGAGVEVLEGHLAGPHFAQHFIDSDKVILVDAIHSGDTPGSIFRFRAEEGIPLLRSQTSHGISIPDILLSARLCGSTAEVIVYAVEIADVRPMAQGLSETVEAVVPELVELVTAEVRDGIVPPLLSETPAPSPAEDDAPFGTAPAGA